jgi:hypothetical protein
MMISVITVGCVKSADQKTEGSAIEFTVVDPEKLPQKLQEAIETNKKNEIRMTYTDGEDMYLVRGYGEQKTGGYSIAVETCIETDEAILFDTQLIGPENQENLSKDPSYPVLVVKIETRDKEAVIQ